MKKFIGKKIITIIPLLFLIIALLPAMTLTAKAEDTSEMSSNETAQAWGFNTSQPEESVKREALGVNPWKGHEDTVSTFGEVPLEIAVTGSRASADNDNHGQNDNDLNDIYYYDNIKRDPSAIGHLTMEAPSGTTGYYENVSGIASSGDNDVKPSTTVAADMNGDGIDEIVRYYINIIYTGTDTDKHDGDISNFNNGVAGYEAYFCLEVINSQTGERMNDEYSGQLLTVIKKNSSEFFIPDSIYYWSSYMQMTAGDFNNDGKKEVALVVPDRPGIDDYNNLYIVGLSGSQLVKSFSNNYTCMSTYGSDEYHIRFSAYHLTSGDCDNDGVDELVFTNEDDVITTDDPSYIHIIDYKNSAYTEIMGKAVQIGTAGDPMGNAGATVGDIDNDGLNEIVVGGFMVNKNNSTATYKYTSKDGSTTKDIPYYHELAMAYIKYNNETNAFSDFQGFTVFRDDEHTAETCESGNDTSYRTFDDRGLHCSRHYRNSDNWTIPIQAVSLTGYVNNMTNDQIFFGNFMYYYNAASKGFAVYDTDGSVNVDADTVVYRDFQAPTSSITAIIPGSFLSDDTSYLSSSGREQLLVAYVKESDGGTRHFEMALMYEDASSSMKIERSVKYVADADNDDFNNMQFYPTVCAPNMDNDAKLVQYVGHAFTYTKPEVLNVIASVPYFKDMMDAYPVGAWGDPGSTYFSKTSGGSQTNKGFTDISLGWYFNFSQDFGVFGIKLFSVELETETSVNTSYEYSKTIEKESTVEYETSQGQDSVVMVSAPLDVYQYRYYTETPEYKTAFPDAVKNNPDTWGTVEVSLPGTPETMVFPVDRYNQLADTYGLQEIDSSFWIHTPGDPGTYPTSTDQFKNASNIISSPNTITATTGGSSMSSELSITKTEENAYSLSLTLGVRVGVGVAGITTGTTFENTTGYGGATASFEGTTIGATLNGFPNPDLYHVTLDTKSYGLSIKLHSYTTKFNGNHVMVLYYTVADYHGLPKLPENFRTTGVTESTIDLAWEVPEVISTKLRPSNYVLERFDPYYKKWITVTDNMAIKAGTNTYTDTDVFAGETYQYRLTAEDSTGTITNAVTLTANTSKAGEAPPVITSQPRNAVTCAGNNIIFSISVTFPEGVSPTRIYYQWYQRKSSSDSWTAITDAIEKTLTLTGITLDMDGYQYSCEATRLGDDYVHCTVQSDYAVLTVLDHVPAQYTVNYYADANGSIKAEQVCTNSSYEIASDSTLPETSKVKFTATPAPGYKVGKWTINGQVVAGNSSNTLVINSLSGWVNVNVIFSISTYQVSYRVCDNYNEGQNGADWGTVSAVCNGNLLPSGEATTLLGTTPITFTATPKSGYMVAWWSVNNQGTGGHKNTYTIDALSQDSEVEIMFTKVVDCTVNVSSKINNTGIAYCDDSSITMKADGVVVQPGSAIRQGTTVDIIVSPPSSAIVESWALNGYPMVGSETSYTFNQLNIDYDIVVNYRIITTKTVTFGTQGGNGTVSAQVVGNTTSTGVVHSGDQVQMYADVAFTVVPGNGDLGVSGWIINGVYETSNSLTRVVKADKNTTVKVVFETLPQPKAPVYEVNMNAHDMVAVDGSSIASDADGDIITITAIEADDIPDKNVATAVLGTGENAGKLMIKGVSVGSTSVKAEVSDDNGHSIIVTIPIKVVMNTNPAPSLTGVINTSVGKDDGKITGLENERTYAYKASDETEYHMVSGVTEITGLKPGSYKVYCPASTGYTESPEVTVVIPLNEFAGGNGEAATPFQITTPEMLDKVRNHLDKCFILMNDLDMTSYLSETGAGYNNGYGFNTINNDPFYGTFDGNGKVISGLFMRGYNSGLFYRMYGTVKNLGVAINLSSSSGTAGGLAAFNYGTIERCYTTGTMKVDNADYIGGMVGLNIGTIENCYSTTSVTGNGHIGGLIGENRGPVKYSYSIGKVSCGDTFISGTQIGGLVGFYNGNTIVNSYFDYQTAGGAARPEGCSTENMKKQATYVGWDFNNIWMINENVDYPKFRQQMVLVSGVALNKTELVLAVDGTETLTAVITPDYAANQNVTWTSSDPSVASVDENGKVTAVKTGTAVITAASQDGSNKTASCIVSIPEGTLESIAVVTGSAIKVIYTVGDSLDITGLTVIGTYSDKTTRPVSITAADVSGFDSSVPVESQTLTISVGQKTATYTITISAAPEGTLESIAVVTGSAIKVIYTVGDSLDITGLAVIGTYSDKTTRPISITAANVSGFDSSVPVESQTLTISVGQKTATYTITISAAPEGTLESITVVTGSAIKVIYTVGDSLDITGLTVIGTYSDKTTRPVSITAANVSGFDSSIPAESQILTVTIGGKTATYQISIQAKTEAALEGIAVLSSSAIKVNYTVGDSLDIMGLLVIGIYSDSTIRYENITAANITGFDSSTAVANQILTVTVKGKTATYTISINNKTSTGGVSSGSESSAPGTGGDTSGSGDGTENMIQEQLSVLVGGTQNSIINAKGTISQTDSSGNVQMQISLPEDELKQIISDNNSGEAVCVDLTVASDKLLEKVIEDSVKKIQVDITVPSSISSANTIDVSGINIAPAILQAAKDTGKDATFSVKDENGKEQYSWSFTGSDLAASTKDITKVNISMEVKDVLDNTEINQLLHPEGNIDTESNSKGLVLSFQQEGELPAQTSVRIYVGDKGFESGDNVYLYHYDPDTGKLTSLPYSTNYKVDEDGYITVNLVHCSEYVVLSEKASSDKITSLKDQISVTPYKTTLYAGGTTGKSCSIRIDLPSTLELVNHIEDKTSGSAVGAVTVSYRSGNPKIASVDENGNVTAKAAGKAKIYTKITLYNRKTKTFATEITVKKAYIKLKENTPVLNIGKKAKFTVSVVGYDMTKLEWRSSKKNIAVVKRNVGKKSAYVTGLTEGTEYIYVQIPLENGKSVTKKIKISVEPSNK